MKTTEKIIKQKDLSWKIIILHNFRSKIIEKKDYSVSFSVEEITNIAFKMFENFLKERPEENPRLYSCYIRKITLSQIETEKTFLGIGPSDLEKRKKV